MANTGRGLPRPIDGCEGHWPPDAMARRCREFVDSRLRRSPPDRASAVPDWTSRGKRYAFPPPCPQVGGCPQASQHPATRQDELISGKGETSSRLPALAYPSPEAVQTTGTVAAHRSPEPSRSAALDQAVSAARPGRAGKAAYGNGHGLNHVRGTSSRSGELTSGAVARQACL